MTNASVTTTDYINSLIWTLFWLLFFIAMISPFLSNRRLQAARLALIRLMERKYGWRVITMIHREEKISFLGIPLRRFIDIEDSEAVLRAIRTTPPDRPIALILHTPGGVAGERVLVLSPRPLSSFSS